MDLVVVEAGVGAHQCPLDVELLYLTGEVEVEGPDDGGPVDVGKQGRRALGQLLRVQAGGLVGQVDRLAPAQ